MRPTFRGLMNHRIGISLLAALFLAGCGGDPGERAFKKGLDALEDARYVHAKAAFQKAIAHQVADPLARSRAHNSLGVAASHLGEIQVAVEAFEESHRLDPDFADPIYNLAVLLQRAGDASQAHSLLEKAARHPPNQPPPQE